jgi:lysophospholipase L1-like esterase
MSLNWETLLCVGDSITIGARSYLGYPEHCGRALQRSTGRYWNVVNHATSGFRVIDLVRDLDQHGPELRSVVPGLCTVMIGTNDAKAPTSVPDLALAFGQLVLKLRLLMNNRNILLLEIPPLQAGVMLPYRTEMNASIDQFNEVIRATGEEHGLMVDRFTFRPDDFFDGVHLCPEGTERWGEQLADMIVRMRHAP